MTNKDTRETLYERVTALGSALPAPEKWLLVRCVYGHGYPHCGCQWRIVAVDPETGGYSTRYSLGDTLPKVAAFVRGFTAAQAQQRIR